MVLCILSAFSLIFFTFEGGTDRMKMEKKNNQILMVALHSKRGKNFFKSIFLPFWNCEKYDQPLFTKRSVFYRLIIQCIEWHRLVFNITNLRMLTVVWFLIILQNKKMGRNMSNPHIYFLLAYFVSSFRNKL